MLTFVFLVPSNYTLLLDIIEPFTNNNRSNNTNMESRVLKTDGHYSFSHSSKENSQFTSSIDNNDIVVENKNDAE